MIRYRKCFFLIASALLIGCLSSHCFGQMTDELESKLARAFDKKTEELILNGNTIRGHQIGGGKFQSCKGNRYDMGDNKPRPSNPCPKPPGTHKLNEKVVTVIRIDNEARILMVKAEDGSEMKIFLPKYFRRINIGGPITSGLSENQVITILYFIDGRAEAYLNGSHKRH